MALSVLVLSLAGACAADESAGGDGAKAPGFAVVELFTSEGCSSCPPADAVVSKLVADAGRSGAAVYCLSFHVDYWNHSGWADRFSSEQATARQKSYAAALRLDQIYTPQMVINGSTEFIGSDQAKADGVIRHELKKVPVATLNLDTTRRDARLTVKFRTTESVGRSVVVAIVQRGLKTEVGGGENGGRVLHHDNVVRSFQTADVPASGEGIVEFDLPADLSTANASVIAFVQDPKRKSITAACGLSLKVPTN